MLGLAPGDPPRAARRHLLRLRRGGSRRVRLGRSRGPRRCPRRAPLAPLRARWWPFAGSSASCWASSRPAVARPDGAAVAAARGRCLPHHGRPRRRHLRARRLPGPHREGEARPDRAVASCPSAREWDALRRRARRPGSDESSGCSACRRSSSSGAEVLMVSADVGDRAQMEEAFRQAEARFGAVHGVIHGAGIVGGNTFRPFREIGRRSASSSSTPRWRGFSCSTRSWRAASSTSACSPRRSPACSEASPTPPTRPPTSSWTPTRTHATSGVARAGSA